ncbi:hypothetical protein GIB67_041933 [Kingdonia uniflora]|uniref:Peptidase A1 domain-containing protein n=1 Tax=Kingdonia uniflora TaxID=39325 RepID=A0A7J7N108_9MAGN|nr:hypothetical protein GIB67_041933 [Kingdonia uniflora]
MFTAKISKASTSKRRYDREEKKGSKENDGDDDESRDSKNVKSEEIMGVGASTGSGQYLVDFRIGSPPQKLLLVADTGSDLVWVKCSACRNCSNHKPGSVFFARHSLTFSPFHCYDHSCRMVRNPIRECNSSREHSTCRYEYTYADGSTTGGFFAREITTLSTSSGRETKFGRLAFGCGFTASGSASSFNGVMGLGRGPISFSTQLGKRFGNKFSYCLMDYTISPPPTSYLFIGQAHTSPRPTTPLQTNPLSPTFYYVGIKDVSVNGVKLKIDSSVWCLNSDGNGGTVIDSGTTLTFLVEPIYSHILTAFKRRVKLPRVEDPSLGFDLCVNVSGLQNPKFPELSFKLVGDSLFTPPTQNYFIDAVEDVKCLAIQPVTSRSGFSVIGNLMQQGFLFEFDRDESKLGFSRHGCALP